MSYASNTFGSYRVLGDYAGRILRGDKAQRSSGAETDEVRAGNQPGRGTLVTTGDPVNDTTLSNKVRNGGSGMPAFRHELSDADIAAVVSFLREKCCWDPENPPPNPRKQRPSL